MGEKQAIRVEFINPFVTAAITVFKTMLGVTLTRGKVFLPTSIDAHQGLTAIVGVSGSVTGIAALQVSDEAAARYAEKFLGCDLLTAPASVSDTIGEICFLIAQAAKGQLEAFNLELAMPVVVRSRETQLDLPRQAMVVGIPFESELGPILLPISMRDKA